MDRAAQKRALKLNQNKQQQQQQPINDTLPRFIFITTMYYPGGSKHTILHGFALITYKKNVKPEKGSHPKCKTNGEFRPQKTINELLCPLIANLPES